jgi:hypothetical protein
VVQYFGCIKQIPYLSAIGFEAFELMFCTVIVLKYSVI